MNTITNIDQIIAAYALVGDILNEQSIDIPVFQIAHPNKNLPEEFILVKSITQYDVWSPLINGAVEICIYVKNPRLKDDQSRPNLIRLQALSSTIVPRLKGGSKNRIAFNDIRTTLVSDPEINYFYQSIVIDTVSINA